MSRSARPALILLGVVAVFAAAVLLSRDRGPATDAIHAQTPTPPAEPPKFVIAPYLQYPTQTSITVMWETATPGTSVVEYGLPSTKLTRVEERKDATIHEVKLDGLEPETKYVYRVSSVLGDRTTVASSLYQFMTAVKADSAFAFCVIGDTQKNPKMT